MDLTLEELHALRDEVKQVHRLSFDRGLLAIDMIVDSFIEVCQIYRVQVLDLSSSGKERQGSTDLTQTLMDLGVKFQENPTCDSLKCINMKSETVTYNRGAIWKLVCYTSVRNLTVHLTHFRHLDPRHFVDKCYHHSMNRNFHLRRIIAHYPGNRIYDSDRSVKGSQWERAARRNWRLFEEKQSRVLILLGIAKFRKLAKPLCKDIVNLIALTLWNIHPKEVFVLTRNSSNKNSITFE